MEKPMLSPKSDYIFKLLFANNRNINALGNFLQAVLDLPSEDYDRLVVVDPHLSPDADGDKTGILDVKVHTKTGKIIDIEIQLLPFSEMRERVVFYTSKMVTGQIGRGQDYDTIKRVVSIVITDYVFIPENRDYHNEYRLRNRKGDSEFTDVIEVDILELPKLPDEKQDSDLWRWMKFLKAERKEDLEMLAQENQYIKQVSGSLMELSQDEAVRLLEEAREKERRDNASRMKGAFREGKLEGLQEGEKKGKLENRKEIAKQMLRDKMPVETISKYTGFQISDIEALAKEI